VITPAEVAERLTNLVTEIRETLDNETADRQQMLEATDTFLTRLSDELLALEHEGAEHVAIVIDLQALFGQ
jgi:hypothetical protein